MQMACCVILCGASSVGKTTLATEWCKKNPEFHHIKEVARDVMNENSITRLDLEKSLKTDGKEFLELQLLILNRQNKIEQDLCGELNSFVSDRGPDPICYAELHCGKKAADWLLEQPAAKSCMQKYQSGNYLVAVLCPLSTTSDDGFRLMPTKQEQLNFTEILCSLLRKCNVPFVYIDTTDLSERLHILHQARKGKYCFDPEKMGTKFPWIFSFPLKNKSGIKRIVITPISVSMEYSAFLRNKTNRMVDRYGRDCFLLVSFHQKLSPKTVFGVLKKGILLNGIEYQFLGCSSGGLKTKTCYMLRGTVKDVKAVLDECGSFFKIRSVSKQLSRIGLLFSEVRPTNVVPTRVVEEKDIKYKSANFTDGCGQISLKLASDIFMGANLEAELPENGYLPSVYQIRFQGCKGVVAVDTNLKNGDLLVRESMKKFEPGSKPFPHIWLCDFSRPYSFGHLNKQFIMLLSGLGIEDNTFLQLQDKHLDVIQSMKEDPEVAFKVLCSSNEIELATKVLTFHSKEDFKTDKASRESLSNLQSKYIAKLSKLRILVQQSRNVFGICDTKQVLEYGECFFRPTINGKPKTIAGLVVVAKNPCYFLGDIRVLTAVSDVRVACLEHLVDCIVFPTKGKQPHSMEIAGSDLDGDQYFVSWEKKLIPPACREPYDYPSVEANAVGEVNRDMLLHYFAFYKNLVGKIDEYYNYWAAVNGVESSQCHQLAELFSRSIDAAKTGDVVHISSKLIPTPDGASDAKITEPVWKRMEEIALRAKRDMSESVIECALNPDVDYCVSEEFIMSLLRDEESNISQFKILLVLYHWCCGQQCSEENMKKFVSLSKYISFGTFTVDEKLKAVDLGVPLEQVHNALTKSTLLPNNFLTNFSLNILRHEWKFYFQANSDNFRWEHLLRALENHSQSLFVFQLTNGVALVLHFTVPLCLGEHNLPTGSVVAYFLSSHFDLQLRHVLGSEYACYLDNKMLQLYRNKNRQATFVWLISERVFKEEDIFDRVSVDLTSFKKDILRTNNHPKVNKQQICAIEVFVLTSFSEPAYLDLHVADQDNVFAGEISEGECFEDLSLDTEQDSFDIDKLMTNTAPNTSSDMYIDEVASLLVSRVHKTPSTSLLECLNRMNTILQQYDLSPVQFLKYLDALGRLHCPSKFLEETIGTLSERVVMCKISEYTEILSDWKLWYFLPRCISQAVATLLYTASKSLLIESCAQWTKYSPGELVELNTSVDIEEGDYHVLKYICHFSYLLLCSLLEDVKSETNSKLKCLKTYQFCESSQESNNDNKVGFSRLKGILSKDFTVGTFVCISLQGGLTVAVGYIAEISRHPANVVVELCNPLPQCLNASQAGKGCWQLEIIGNVTAFNRSMKAIQSLNTAKTTGLTPILVHPCTFVPFKDTLHKETIPHSCIETPSSSSSCQEQAINAACCKRLTIIHGPPGTGKTHVACEIIGRIGKTRAKVLAAAETNMAVDNLTRKLLECNIRVLRLGSEENIAADIRQNCLDHQLQMKRIELGKKQKVPYRDAKMAKKLINASQVVTVTCAGAGDPLLQDLAFPFVLIDEATQTTEPTSLIPLVLQSKQLVLIGDPQQLSPTIHSTDFAPITQLSVTLFHRLQAVLPSFFLNIQYRMHPYLAEFPSQSFYDGKLKTEFLSKHPWSIEWLPLDRPIVFFDTEIDCQERKVGTSFENANETDLVVKIVKNLIGSEVSPFEIAVLTPYSAQVHSLQKSLSSSVSNVEVCSIDGFQGREKEIVVFSTVRSNSAGSLGFTDDRYRMNVLLTRAKHAVIGVGSKSTLVKSNSPLWIRWLQHVQILSEDFFHVQRKQRSTGQSKIQHVHARGSQKHTSRRFRKQ